MVYTLVFHWCTFVYPHSQPTTVVCYCALYFEGENYIVENKHKQLHLSKYEKYFGVKADKNLEWKDHVKEVLSKLKRGNSINKVFSQRNKETLLWIYFTTFHSYILPIIFQSNCFSKKLLFDFHKFFFYWIRQLHYNKESKSFWIQNMLNCWIDKIDLFWSVLKRELPYKGDSVSLLSVRLHKLFSTAFS